MSDNVQQIQNDLEKNTIDISSRLEQLETFVKSEINNRLLTIEWLSNDYKSKLDHLVYISDFLVSKARMSDFNVQQNLKAFPDYSLQCTRQIAVDSNDHLEPESTYEGNVAKPEFVHACERQFSRNHLKFLDIGCGSGALVYDFIKRGHFAIGLEGSDACKIRNLGYWGDIPHLHNCDVTKPFSLLNSDNNVIHFDVISMWEVFEHIPEPLCGNVLNNIANCLTDDGFFIGSISTLEYVNQKTGTPYHVTLHNKGWWQQLFLEYGLIMTECDFKLSEYCRGVGGSYQDCHSYKDNPEAGFHFFAKKR